MSGGARSPRLVTPSFSCRKDKFLKSNLFKIDHSIFIYFVVATSEIAYHVGFENNCLLYYTFFICKIKSIIKKFPIEMILSVHR